MGLVGENKLRWDPWNRDKCKKRERGMTGSEVKLRDQGSEMIHGGLKVISAKVGVY